MNVPVAVLQETPRVVFDLTRYLDRMLIAAYAPAGVIVNEKLDVIHFRGRTGPYLEPAPRQPQNNVLKMAREGLLIPLKAALAQAKKLRKPVRKRAVEVGERGATVHCDVVVMPLTGWAGSQEPLYAVLFEEFTPHPEETTGRHGASGRTTKSVIKLKRELSTSKAYVQSLLEEHSRVTDDLGTANEELVSGNEELQSMNEELRIGPRMPFWPRSRTSCGLRSRRCC